MDLSILVFFQNWLINSRKELTNHSMSDRNKEGSLTEPPSWTR